MTPQDMMERRRHRRIRMQTPCLVKRLSEGDGGVFKDGTTKDVSLAGAYLMTAGWEMVEPDDVVTVSISVPKTQGRDFPFARLAGRARVVRVDELARIASEGRRLLGIALEFATDLTVLTMAPNGSG